MYIIPKEEPTGPKVNHTRPPFKGGEKKGNPTRKRFYDRPPDAQSGKALHPTRGGEREREGGSNCLSDGTTDAIEESGGKNATERNNEGLLKKRSRLAGTSAKERRKGKGKGREEVTPPDLPSREEKGKGREEGTVSQTAQRTL